MWPLIVVDHFFTFVNQSLAHVQQSLPCQCVTAVINLARLVRNASHFEKFHRVRRYSSTRQAFFVHSYRPSSDRLINAVNRETVEDLVFNDFIGSTEVALQ